MTKKGKRYLGIICFLIFVALIYPEENAYENNTQNLTAEANQNGQISKNDKKITKSNHKETKRNLEIKGLRKADENPEICNPFTYAHETRDDKSGETVVQPQITTRFNADIPQTVAESPKEILPIKQWKLTSIISSKDSQIAVLSNDNASAMFSVGDVFDDKTIAFIGEDYILYSGKEGEGRLDLLSP